MHEEGLKIGIFSLHVVTRCWG